MLQKEWLPPANTLYIPARELTVINIFLSCRRMTAKMKFLDSGIMPIVLYTTGQESYGSIIWCLQKILLTSISLQMDCLLINHLCSRDIVHLPVNLKIVIRA